MEVEVRVAVDLKAFSFEVELSDQSCRSKTISFGIPDVVQLVHFIDGLGTLTVEFFGLRVILPRELFVQIKKEILEESFRLRAMQHLRISTHLSYPDSSPVTGSRRLSRPVDLLAVSKAPSQSHSPIQPH